MKKIIGNFLLAFAAIAFFVSFAACGSFPSGTPHPAHGARLFMIDVPGGIVIGSDINAGIFIKYGGIVYGSDANESLRNTTINTNGAAVYASNDAFGGNAQFRNTTLNENNNFDSRLSGSAGGWE